MRAWMAVLALLATTAKPKPVPKTKVDELDRRVAAVKAHVAKIDRGSAKRVDKSMRGCTAKGGVMSAWLAGDKVVKLTDTIYEDTGETNERFWFDEAGKLLYAQVEHVDYAVHEDEDGGQVIDKSGPKTSDEYFFENGGIIRWTSGPRAPEPGEVSATADERVRAAKDADNDVEC